MDIKVISFPSNLPYNGRYFFFFQQISLSFEEEIVFKCNLYFLVSLFISSLFYFLVLQVINYFRTRFDFCMKKFPIPIP